MDLHRRIEALYDRVEQHGAYFRGLMRVDPAFPKPLGKPMGVRVDPIVCALAIKAATTKRAIVALCEIGDGDNAFVLTRVLLENACLLEWLIRGDGHRRRLEAYAVFTSVAHERVVATLGRFRDRFVAAGAADLPKSDPYQRAVAEQLFGGISEERPTWNLRDNGTLVRVSVKKMFEDVTYSEQSYEHQIMYGALGSELVHSGPFSLATAITALEERGITFLQSMPNPDKCTIALATSNSAMFLVLDSLNEYVGLGLGDDLAALKAENPKDPEAAKGAETGAEAQGSPVPIIKKQWIDVPRKVLSENKQDALIVLRLGAFANAVQGILMRFIACLHEEPDSTGSERDRLTLFLAGAGYMKEAVDHIQHRQVRLRELLKLARSSGYPLTAKWTEMEDLLTTTPGSVYDRVLKRVRHDLAFHFKEDVFLRWMEKTDQDPVRLWDIDGTKNAGRLYRASSDALAFDLAEGKETADPSLRDAFAAVRDAQLMLLPVAEAAFVGFIATCGLDPNTHYHYEEN
jgi:hypothetical protein